MRHLIQWLKREKSIVSPPASPPESKIQQRFATLQAKIELLAPRQRVFYALNCAEQVFPLYEQWAKNEGLNSAETLHTALVLIQNTLDDPQKPLEKFHALREQIEAGVPDTEENEPFHRPGDWTRGWRC